MYYTSSVTFAKVTWSVVHYYFGVNVIVRFRIRSCAVIKFWIEAKAMTITVTICYEIICAMNLNNLSLYDLMRNFTE